MDAKARAVDDPRGVGTARRLGVLTVAGTLWLAGMGTAAAQGDPVGGVGSHYLLSGAGDTTGAGAEEYWFAKPGDQAYAGDFVGPGGTLGGDGRDDVMVRRGNTYTVRGQGGRTFTYGDPGDTVLVGDWDGDGTDTLAVRRGNVYVVSNDLATGRADHSFVFGDPGDTVLVGNWDGDTSRAGDARPVTTDTLMVRRGNRYFVKNDTGSGVADYDVTYGEPGDVVLVGDWAPPPGSAGAGRSGDHADALALRRGNQYLLSEEVWTAESRPSGSVLRTAATITYGEPSDTVFTAQLPRTAVVDGVPRTVYGDGLGMRRDDVALGVPRRLPPPAAAAGPAVRTYTAVGDSLTAGREPQDRLDALGATSWLHGETAERFRLQGGWAVSGATTWDMRANVVPTAADVLVLLGGTNDLLRGIPWAETADNLRAIAATVGARQTLLVGIVPITEFPARRGEFNARLAALAGELGWRYVDPWTPLAEGDAWAPGTTTDNLHPDPGSAVLAGRTIADEAWQAAAQRTGR